ncbi:glycosyltransferase family 4 protein [Desulfolithobacter sp.]
MKNVASEDETEENEAKAESSFYEDWICDIMKKNPVRIVHVITGLQTGGAEMMLCSLLSAMDRTVFSSEVISLVDTGPIGERIMQSGTPVQALGMRRGVPDPVAVLSLARKLRLARPDIVQTWMYHADLIGGLAAKLAGNVPVVWGIHNVDLDPEVTKQSTIWTARACAGLSRWLPGKIICCADVARQIHVGLGYDASRMVVIPNGFDTDKFRPDAQKRAMVRRELGIQDEALLVGMVGRFHPLKDHRNFIKAASLLHKKIPDVEFLLCGEGLSWENRALSEWIDSAGLRNHFHLPGRRKDIPAIMSALDVYSSSSAGEAFPLVIGEAMACGVVCVVTDVGDSGLIVGDTGAVVEPRNAKALAGEIERILKIPAQERRALGERARARILENFRLDVVADLYTALYHMIHHKTIIQKK